MSDLAAVLRAHEAELFAEEAEERSFLVDVAGYGDAVDGKGYGHDVVPPVHYSRFSRLKGFPSSAGPRARDERAKASTTTTKT